MKKRIISLAMALMMCLSLSVTAFATESNKLTDQEFVAARLSTKLQNMLSTGSFGITANNIYNLYVGNPIAVYIFENAKLIDIYQQYPILYNKSTDLEVVGLARVIEYEGERLLDYGVDHAPNIQSHLEENGNIPIVLAYNDGLFSIMGNISSTSTSTSTSSSSPITSQLMSKSLNLQFASLEAIKKIEAPIMTFTAPTSTAKHLDIDHVSQNGQPICWAACIASIVNYHQMRDLRAVDVALVAHNLGYTDTVYSGGNITIARKTINYYGGSNTAYFSPVSYSTIKTNINKGIPLYVEGYRYIEEDGDYVMKRHAVVIYGYEPTGTKTIYYMEPNSSMKSIEVPSTGTIIFNGATSSVTYINDEYMTCRS